MKKNRTVLRSSVIKLINGIENAMKEDPIDFDNIEESLDQLNTIAEVLKLNDEKLETLIS